MEPPTRDNRSWLLNIATNTSCSYLALKMFCNYSGLYENPPSPLPKGGKEEEGVHVSLWQQAMGVNRGKETQRNKLVLPIIRLCVTDMFAA